MSANMREAQKRKRLRLSLSTFLPSNRRVPTEFDQPRLLVVDFQSELPQPFLKIDQKLLGDFLMLKPHDKIVGITHDNHIAARHFLPPCLNPKIEDVMQVDVRQERRNYCPLRRPYLRLRPLAFLRYSRPQPFPDQAKYSSVSDPMLHKLQHPFVAYPIEEAPNVRVQNPVHSLSLNAHGQRIQRSVGAAFQCETALPPVPAPAGMRRSGPFKLPPRNSKSAEDAAEG